LVIRAACRCGWQVPARRFEARRVGALTMRASSSPVNEELGVRRRHGGTVLRPDRTWVRTDAATEKALGWRQVQARPGRRRRRTRSESSWPPRPQVSQEFYRRGNHGHLTTNQIGRQCGQSIVMAVRPAISSPHSYRAPSTATMSPASRPPRPRCRKPRNAVNKLHRAIVRLAALRRP
jgi:hypothetical protein